MAAVTEHVRAALTGGSVMLALFAERGRHPLTATASSNPWPPTRRTAWTRSATRPVMAKVFDFLHMTNEVLTEHGVELPLSGQSTTTPETRLAQGLAVQKAIVGADRVDGLRLGPGRRAARPAVPVGQLLR